MAAVIASVRSGNSSLTLRAPRRTLLMRACLVFVILAGTSSFSCASDTSRVTQVEAAFVFNFTKFVEWPDATFRAPSAPLEIGVLGDGPLSEAISAAVNGESAHGHPLAVKKSTKLDDLLTCQIVFVTSANADHIADILKGIGKRPILTVSDIDGFGQSGGMIQFYLDGTKLRFLINPTVAQEVDLKLGAQLLSIAKIIGDGRTSGKP